MLWALLVFAVLLSLPACIGYLIFYYESANDGHAEDVRRRHGPPLRCMVLAGLRSMAGMFAILASSLLYYLRILRPSRWPRRTEGTPVILVHGLYHNETGWLLFQRRLQAAGLPDIRVYSYNGWSGRPGDLVDDLASRVERVFEERGRPVALAGHSLGGLLIRGCLRRPELRGKICCVATMGTPAEGSRLAVLGPGPLAARIVQSSPEVAELAGEQAFEAPALALASDLDDMVLPFSSLTAAQHPGWRLELSRPVSHITMLYDADCFRRVLDFWIECGVERA
ncbi:MAG: esterase/lipase family protein [Desulfovibrionaceae bacterium]